MAYAIGKAGMHGARYMVTAVRQGGRLLDNVRVEPGREAATMWQARTWATRAAADKARERLATVGGYDDYHVCDLGEA